MKKYIKLGLLLVGSQLLVAQQDLTNKGATIHIGEQTTLTITEGDLVNQANGTILNAGQITLEKDWIQEEPSAAYLGAGSLWFNGTGQQSIVSPSELVIHQLVINNGHQLDLNAPIKITQHADLSQNSQVVLNNHHCTLAPAVVISNYDEQHYVVTNKKGRLQQHVGVTETVFPVGNAYYNPIVMTNQGLLDQFSIRVASSEDKQGTANTTAVDAIWLIDEATKGGSLATFKVDWTVEQEGSQFSREQAGIAFLEGEDWQHPLLSAPILEQSTAIQTAKEVAAIRPIRVQSKGAPVSEAASTVDWSAEEAITIQAFPNPVTTSLHILSDATLEEAAIEVVDSKGSLLLQTTQTIVAGSPFQLEGMADWPEGLYWVHIRQQQTTVFSQQIIKK